MASIPNPLTIPDRVLACLDAAIKLEARSGEIVERGRKPAKDEAAPAPE